MDRIGVISSNQPSRTSPSGGPTRHRISAQTLRVDVTDLGRVPEATRRVEGRDYPFFGTDPDLLAKKQEAFDYVAGVWASR